MTTTSRPRLYYQEPTPGRITVARGPGWRSSGRPWVVTVVFSAEDAASSRHATGLEAIASAFRLIDEQRRADELTEAGW